MDWRDEAELLGNRILDGVKDDAPALWDSLNGNERQIFEQASQDAAILQVREFATGRREQAEWLQIDAQFKNIGVASQLAARRAFFGSVAKVAKGLLGGLVQFAVGLIP